MKKVLICGVIAAAFGMTSAMAGSAVADFDVKATVVAQCVTDNATTPAVNFGPITAFDTTAITDATANVKFKCTRGLAISGVTLSSTASTVAGLAYTLAVDAGTKVGGAAASGGTGAGADAWTYVVTGSMAAGQAGDKNAPTTDAQTLTVSF